MNESSSSYMEAPNRFHLGWITEVFFRPQRAFEHITSQPGNNTWLTPLIVLLAAILVNVLASGYINQQAVLTGNLPMPPDFQYWLPEQQAQYMQSLQTRQGPTFLYVIPAIGALAAGLIGWLITGGILHLVMTMLGGRGETGTSMSLVAWASLPLALGKIVQALYMLSTQKLIQAEGLAGFVNIENGGASYFLYSFAGLITVYLVWHIVLIIIGVRTFTGLPRLKTILGVIGVMLVIMLVQALFGYLGFRISELSIIRPFFF